MKNKSANSDIGRTHFVEMQLRDQYRMQKNKENYYRCISTVCKDLMTKVQNNEQKIIGSDHKFHMFTRGDPLMLIQNCSDFWNGEEVAPINKSVLQSLKDIIKQWNMSDLDVVAFAYKPVIRSMYEYINKPIDRQDKSTHKRMKRFERRK